MLQNLRPVKNIPVVQNEYDIIMYLKISLFLVLGCPRREGVHAAKQGMVFRVLSLTQGILFHPIHFQYLSS